MKKILFDNHKNVISKRLQEFRKAKGLSQSQLAAKMQTMGVNLDQQMISRVENNRRIVTDFELLCFCDVLGLDLSELLRQCQAERAAL